MQDNIFYQMTPREVLDKLNVVKESGLSTKQIEELRKIHNWNELTPPEEASIFKIFYDALKEPMMIILLIAAMISFLIGQISDGIGIICAIIIGISIGVFVEGESKKATEELKKACENIEVKVIRNGEITLIESRELIPGDIVIMQSGDKVPADGRLIESTELKIDESMLTGESKPVLKNADLVLKSNNVIPADRKNMLFSGTLVTEGSGVFVVVNTGDCTEIGKISKNLSEEDTETPLQQKLGDLGARISKISSIIALLLFIFMVFKRWPEIHFDTSSLKAFLTSIAPIKDAFVVSVALIVAAVPEGLPTMVNMTLAITMKRMAQINALVRKKEACETIGSVSVICSDKTGTLTQNKMTVVDLYIGDNFKKAGKLNQRFIDNCILNSSANLEIKNNKINFIGNTTECSLLQYLYKNNIDYKHIRNSYRIAKQFEFSSTKKMMFTLVKEKMAYIFYMKGAPEKVLERCKYIDINGDVIVLDQKNKKNIEENIKKLQSEAKRILAFGYKKISSNININSDLDEKETDFIFTGFTGIMDPLRPEVKEAVLTAKKAGIETKILTGDNIHTAVAIANQLGILSSGKKAVTSSEIDKMNDYTLKAEIDNIGVVARSTPDTKMRIVQILKSKNQVVAVTGDGINDAPALVKSDVGISMGITGTEVSQEASDIILKDDSFATIIKSIKWGRGIYENFQRFIQFQLTVNIVAFLVAILSTIFGYKLPFTTIQLLWVNIIMDGPPALSLGLEPIRDRVLKRKPINRNSSIVTSKMFKSMIFNAVLMVVGILCISRNPQIIAGRHLNLVDSLDNKLYGTILFSVFAFFALWNTLNCREFGNDSILPNFLKNRFSLLILGITAAVQIMIIQFASKFFNASPLDFTTWVRIISYTFSVVGINEIIKFISRLLQKDSEANKPVIVLKW